MQEFPANQGRFREMNRLNFPLPTAPIEVKFTRLQNVLLIGLVMFFGLITTFNLYQTLTSPFSSSREILFKGAFSLFTVALIAVLIFLPVRAERKSARIFDASGVTRGDGRHFSWADFQGLQTKTARRRFGGLYVWREELAFAGGETVWIIPNRVKNYQEVFGFLKQLPKDDGKN